jgi:tetratricopeptide (TPR) repeat protein
MAQNNGIELIGRPQWHARWRAGWRRLIAWSDALPALLAAALVTGLGVVASSKPLDETQAAYAREGDRAFQAGDYATARVCYGRLANVPDPRPEALWGLALTYEAGGDMGRAASLYDRLAPLESAGYAPAQVRRARALLKTPAASPLATRAVAAAEQHLRRALESDARSVEVNALLGQLLLTTDRPGQAAVALARAAGEKRELRMTAAMAYAAAGQQEFGRHEAELALREATQLLATSPDDLAARVRLAKAAVFLGDHALAANVLRLGLQRTGDPRYRSRLAEVFAVWSDAEAAQPSADPDRTLLRLEEGLRFDPNSGPLLERFARVLQSAGPRADKARRTLRDLLASGEGGAGAHFALGIDAWLRGEAGPARIHLEEAARLFPNGPAIANNLAWVLAHSPEHDLSRALALVELALDRQPGNAQYRGTRGSILARLGRPKDALPDLEAALTTYPNDTELHRDLADVYARLGLADMAAVHSARAAAPRPGPR